jgi:hypothetical protein
MSSSSFLKNEPIANEGTGLMVVQIDIADTVSRAMKRERNVAVKIS